MASRTAQAQVNRDKNALRGLFNRKPTAMTMQDIKLAAGEDMAAAVFQMVDTNELITYMVDDKRYYFVGDLKPYKPSTL